MNEVEIGERLGLSFEVRMGSLKLFHAIYDNQAKRFASRLEKQLTPELASQVKILRHKKTQIFFVKINGDIVLEFLTHEAARTVSAKLKVAIDKETPDGQEA